MAEPNNDIFTIFSPSMSKIWVTFHAKIKIIMRTQRERSRRRNHNLKREVEEVYFRAININRYYYDYYYHYYYYYYFHYCRCCCYYYYLNIILFSFFKNYPQN